MLLTRRCPASWPREVAGTAWSWALGEPGTPSLVAAPPCAIAAPGTPRHHPQPQASVPLSCVAAPGRPHPVTPAALHSCLFDTSPVTPARLPPTPSAHVLLRSLPAPTSPAGPRPPGNLWTQAGRCLVLPQAHLGARIDGVTAMVSCMLCIMCDDVIFVEPCITFNIIEVYLFPDFNHCAITGLGRNYQASRFHLQKTP